MMSRLNSLAAFSGVLALALSTTLAQGAGAGAVKSSAGVSRPSSSSCSLSNNGECSANDAAQLDLKFLYQDVCTKPKSCSPEECTWETLKALSLVRETLQRDSSAASASAAAKDNAGETLAREMERAQVRLEEAAVGCTLLYKTYLQETPLDHYDGSEYDNFKSACPVPKTCTYDSKSCTMDVLGHLKQSRQHLQNVMEMKKKSSKNDDDDNNDASLGSQLGIAELTVEEAAVGCTVMLAKLTQEKIGTGVGESENKSDANNNSINHRTSQQCNAVHNNNDNKNNNGPKQPPSPIFPSHDILQDEDSLDLFLMEHFPTEMFDLGKIKVRRRNLQDILLFAGVGEVPDARGEELVKREKKIAELLGEEAKIRKGLLMRLHQRNTQARQGEGGANGYGEEDKNDGQCGQNLVHSSPNSNSNYDNHQHHDNATKMRDASIAKMEKDIAYLIRKAGDATTGEERDARWRMVTSLKKKLIQMKRLRYMKEGIPFDEKPLDVPVTGHRP